MGGLELPVRLRYSLLSTRKVFKVKIFNLNSYDVTVL